MVVEPFYIPFSRRIHIAYEIQLIHCAGKYPFKCHSILDMSCEGLGGGGGGGRRGGIWTLAVLSHGCIVLCIV